MSTPTYKPQLFLRETKPSPTKTKETNLFAKFCHHMMDATDVGPSLWTFIPLPEILTLEIFLMLVILSSTPNKLLNQDPLTIFLHRKPAQTISWRS